MSIFADYEVRANRAGPSDRPHTAEAAEQNRLLRVLPREEREQLLPHLKPVALAAGRVLYRPNEPIRYVYFPRTVVVSLVTITGDGTAVEAASIGNEGVVGLPIFLALADAASPLRAVVQIAGDAERMEAALFLAAVWEGAWLRALLRRYAEALLNQTTRSAACSRLHPTAGRCAHWLLTTHDQVDGDSFALTQRFLSRVLGVRRAGVTAAAGVLQTAGLIRYSRGKITVVDRAGLEAASCECYQAVRADFDRLLGAPDGRASGEIASEAREARRSAQWTRGGRHGAYRIGGRRRS